ncbi:hypothetical protein AQUCO_05800090v1 [Aquilegia coerulea]|uniref:Cytochrome P450 n=1 Tax=Aquilegia coerulea TaxID=218851 RepID=A0A2G5CEN4_AQUCA|nr:hypothetical protein AQUCO_05800090v1 [Aquilegia coerulea]
MEKCLRDQGITGPPYQLLYGNTKEILMSMKKEQAKPMEISHHTLSRILPFDHQAVEDYGKSFVSWYGPTPRVNIMDPEVIRDILSDKFGHFGKVQNPFAKVTMQGLFTYEGEKWVKHRRIINPAFHQEKLKMMLPAFTTSCMEVINKWQKLVSEGSFELDVWSDIQNLSADVISRTAFGSSYEEGRRIFQLQTEQAKLIMQLAISIYTYIPGFWFLPTKTNKRIKEIYREVRTLLREIIKKRERGMRFGKTNNADLLGILMESNLKEIENGGSDKNVGMSIDEVIEECKLFYFAGQETTSSLLVWTMIVLSMHPEWQQKAREEVMQVIGKRTPDFEDLNQLKIVTMIIYEVLRLYPPVAAVIRATHKKTNVGKVALPPGVQISLPILFVNHDSTFWGEDVEHFNPERFSGGISKATKNQVSFFPFGWGPRICIGQTFSMIEAKMAVAMILQNFSFKLSATYQHAPYTIITLQPQHGAQLILRKL